MDIHNLLIKYTTYNLWANQSITNWLLNKDESYMTKEVKSSFATINETLVHMWFAEHLWLHRLQNTPFTNIKQLAADKNSGFIVQGMIAESDLFNTYVANLKQEDLERKIQYSYLNSDNIEESPVWMVVQHIMNHSTYHRGQLVTMGRELGFTDPPETDFIQYFREN